MVRVCTPGGRVLVADVCVADENSGDYDRMEKLRDDSHVHDLTESEFTVMFRGSGLTDLKRSVYGLDTEVEKLLASSSPGPGNDEKVRKMKTADIGVNRLGIDARYDNGKLTSTFPIAVYTGRKE